MLTLVSQARRRLLYNELLSQGANSASAALLAFILLLLLGTQVLNWQWLVLVPLGAAAVGFYRARRHLPSPYGTAQIVDHRAGLADNLSTALYFSQPEAASHVQPEIRQMQYERADRLAQTVDVRQAIPYTVPRTVYVVAALFLVASSLFALRYGLSRRLDLRQPLATMLQQTFGGDEPVVQAKNQKRMRQPEPETRPDDSGDTVKDPDQKPGDQQDANSAEAEESGDSQKPSGEQKATSGDSKKQDEGDKAEGDPGDQKDAQGDEKAGNEGDEQGTSKANDGKGDQKQDPNAKQDSNNAGENSSLMSKVKDFAQNLLSRVKPQQGQSSSQQQSPGDQKSNQAKGQQQSGKQQASKEGQPQNGGQQGEAQEGQAGEQAQDSQDPQGKGTGKSDSQQPSKQPGSGIGSQDGDKSVKQAQDLAAMGKISEILGKRSATITGESTVEVQQTSQQLHTPYATRGAQHSQSGAEIRRDEIPAALQTYVEQYFEQVRKQQPAATPAPAKKQE